MGFNNDMFGGGMFMPFPSLDHMQGSFDKMRDHMMNMQQNGKKDNDTHSYSHSEQYFETIDNNNGDAKRVEVG